MFIQNLKGIVKFFHNFLYGFLNNLFNFNSQHFINFDKFPKVQNFLAIDNFLFQLIIINIKIRDITYIFFIDILNSHKFFPIK